MNRPPQGLARGIVSAAVAGVIALALAGCVTQEAPQPGSSDGGITADEARESGVFAADGDGTVAISRVETAARVIHVTVTNLGSVDEDYVVRALVDDVEVESIELRLASGDSVETALRLPDPTGQQDVTVVLDGTLLGDRIASESRIVDFGL